MSGVVGDLDVIEAVIQEALVDESVAYLNRPFTPPQKTQAPGAPASFYTFEGVEYADTEDADFAGGELRFGDAIVGCWVEPGAGEQRVQEMVDTVRHGFDDADADGMTFLRPTPEYAGFVERGGDVWYGWMVRTPFIAQG